MNEVGNWTRFDDNAPPASYNDHYSAHSMPTLHVCVSDITGPTYTYSECPKPIKAAHFDTTAHYGLSILQFVLVFAGLGVIFTKIICALKDVPTHVDAEIEGRDYRSTLQALLGQIEVTHNWKGRKTHTYGVHGMVFALPNIAVHIFVPDILVKVHRRMPKRFSPFEVSRVLEDALDCLSSTQPITEWRKEAYEYTAFTSTLEDLRRSTHDD